MNNLGRRRIQTRRNRSQRGAVDEDASQCMWEVCGGRMGGIEERRCTSQGEMKTGSSSIRCVWLMVTASGSEMFGVKDGRYELVDDLWRDREANDERWIGRVGNKLSRKASKMSWKIVLYIAARSQLVSKPCMAHSTVFSMYSNCYVRGCAPLLVHTRESEHFKEVKVVQILCLLTG